MTDPRRFYYNENGDLVGDGGRTVPLASARSLSREEDEEPDEDEDEDPEEEDDDDMEGEEVIEDDAPLPTPGKQLSTAAEMAAVEAEQRSHLQARQWKTRTELIQSGFPPPRGRGVSRVQWPEHGDTTFRDVAREMLKVTSEGVANYSLRDVAQEFSDYLADRVRLVPEEQLSSEIAEAVSVIEDLSKNHRPPAADMADKVVDIEHVLAPRSPAKELPAIEPVKIPYGLKMKTLQDLVANYPIGDGWHYIHVERRSPQVFQGMHIAGVQASINEAEYTFPDFVRDYGGGAYLLTVYGPSEAITEKTTNPKVIALTAPVKLGVPMATCPPNPAAAAMSDGFSEEGAMNVGAHRNMFQRTSATSPADARMFEAELAHRERLEEREERRRQQREQREARLTEEAEARGISVAQLIAEQNERAAEREARLREKYESREREREREMVQLQREKPTDFQGIASILAAMRPSGPEAGELQRIERAYSDERARVAEQHRSEMERLREANRQELEVMRRMAEEQTRRMEERLRDERERVDRAMRDAESNASRRVKEVEDRARRDVEDARNESSRRIQEMQLSHQARIEDIRANHERELRAATTANSMALETNKTTLSMQLALKDEELAKTRAEMERIRQELEVERSKSVVDRVGEVTQVAEALGFSKGSGDEPADLKTMLGQAAIGMIPHVPALASSIADMVASRRGGAPAPAAQIAAPRMAPPPMLPAPMTAPVPPVPSMRFATEHEDLGGMGVVGGSSGSSMPWGPGESRADSFNAPVNSAPVHQPQPQPRRQRRQPQPQPVQQQEQPQALPQPEPGPEIPDEQIIPYLSPIQEAYEAGKPPEKFAAEMIEGVPPELAAQILGSLTLDRVLSVAGRDASGPMARRDGQNYIRGVWGALGAMLSSVPG